MNTITEEEAWRKVAAYCAASEHCRSEIAEKLLRWEIDEEASRRILDKLQTEDYLNEERYCRAFVHDKFRFSKWGKLKIKEALYAKGISSAVARCHLDEINQDEYLAVLREILKTKRKSIRARDDYELNAKLARFALSRGFEWKDIRLCVQIQEEE